MDKIGFSARVFEDERFILEQSAECPIPGYLVLRLKGGETRLTDLAPRTARALGTMLQNAAKAIAQAVQPERVYVLSFCEVDPGLHFHLFPRSAWLLREYVKANDCANDPVNGPMLFEWARRTYGPGRSLPEAMPDMESACAIMRGKLQ